MGRQCCVRRSRQGFETVRRSLSSNLGWMVEPDDHGGYVTPLGEVDSGQIATFWWRFVAAASLTPSVPMPSAWAFGDTVELAGHVLSPRHGPKAPRGARHPSPGLVRAGRMHQGCGVAKVAMPATSFPNQIVFVQDPIHGAFRAQVDAFIEQSGINLGRGQVTETVRAQHRRITSRSPSGIFHDTLECSALGRARDGRTGSRPWSAWRRC